MEDCQIEIPKKTVETVLRDPPRRLSLGNMTYFGLADFPYLALSCLTAYVMPPCELARAELRAAKEKVRSEVMK